MSLSNEEFKGVVITKLEYLEKNSEKRFAVLEDIVKNNCSDIEKVKDWQQTIEAKIKTGFGILSFVGSIVFFLAGILLDFIKERFLK